MNDKGVTMTFDLEKAQEVQSFSKVFNTSPGGSSYSVQNFLSAIKSIFKDQPEKIKFYENSFNEHIEKNKNENYGTWWNGVFYKWDMENGYPWTIAPIDKKYP